MHQIAQLKYHMNFSLFEIATMTAEEREFFLEWYVEAKKKENEAYQSAQTKYDKTQPHFGPAANA